VIYCVGETWAEREKGNTFSVLSDQIKKGLKDVPSDKFKNLVIAYEPVWAIGTGKVATPKEAEEAHAYIRKEISSLFVGGEEIANQIQILYGGSVKPDNIASLLSQPNIDGGLVGGASQKLDSFLGLLK
jgi:triosephosphate isomerase